VIRSRSLLLFASLMLSASTARAEDTIRISHPLMWQVRSANTTIYLFGTIHVGRSEFYPLPEHVERALTQSTALVVEAKHDGGAAGAQAGHYTAPDSLDQHIPSALLAQLNAVLPRYGFSRADALRLRPWRLGIRLTFEELALHDFDPRLAVDAYLSDSALRAGKSILALETEQTQTDIMESLSAPEQEAILQASLAQIATGRVAPLMQAIVAAWGWGDVRRCEKALAASYADLPLAQTINAKLISARNARFFKKVEAFLRGRETIFVAVGTAHLIGKDGVIARLRKRGYRVKQI
jgi:uncharacterized protein